MKREVKMLLDSGVDSLVLSIEHFNRCDDRGRHNATLILQTHGFEMLLKAAILYTGGSLREKGSPHTVGLTTCIKRARSEGSAPLIGDEQAMLLRATYGLRSAAQHHLLRISEEQLYLHVQGGLTLFRDVYKSVFARDLASDMPKRVLPVSTVPPADIEALFLTQTAEALKLLAPGKRRRAQALARLEPLAILSGAMEGADERPTSIELLRLAKRLRDGVRWEDVFPGAATVSLTSEESGRYLQLRFVKRGDETGAELPIVTVPDGTGDVTLVGLKRVNELDYYSMNHTQLAEAIGISSTKLTAYLAILGLKNDSNCSKEFPFGKKTRMRQYSRSAISRVRNTMKDTPPDEAWLVYREMRKATGT